MCFKVPQTVILTRFPIKLEIPQWPTRNDQKRAVCTPKNELMKNPIAFLKLARQNNQIVSVV